MAEIPGTVVCPKGHASTETDYCSECGAKLQGTTGVPNGGAGQSGSAMGQVCPDCGTLRERNDTVFCEVCGYNFATGAHGEVRPAVVDTEDVPAVAVPEKEPAAAGAVMRQRWSVIVSVDPALRGADSPEAPEDVPTTTVVLEEPVSLIGRRDEGRGVFPEIALGHDEAVSRRHAVLQAEAGGGLFLRDIGSSNGTRLNGVEVKPMTDAPLKAGDEITLGHWSRLRVEVS